MTILGYYLYELSKRIYQLPKDQLRNPDRVAGKEGVSVVYLIFSPLSVFSLSISFHSMGQSDSSALLTHCPLAWLKYVPLAQGTATAEAAFTGQTTNTRFSLS